MEIDDIEAAGFIIIIHYCLVDGKLTFIEHIDTPVFTLKKRSSWISEASQPGYADSIDGI